MRTLMNVERGYAQPEGFDGFRPRGRRYWRWLVQRDTRGGKPGVLGSIGDQPVMADAHEALGQHVQQESPDEFAGFKREDLAPVAVGVVLVAQRTRRSSKLTSRLLEIATRWV
jgi:hypothetical protein